MIEGYSPVVQSFLGSLFTWFMTAAGAALVYVLRGNQRKILDASLGFAAGVMLAASYWSLLAPALELASTQQSHLYGAYPCIPVTVGFLLGAAFVYGADVLLPHIHPGIGPAEVVYDTGKAKREMDTNGGGDYARKSYYSYTQLPNGNNTGVSEVTYRGESHRGGAGAWSESGGGPGPVSRSESYTIDGSGDGHGHYSNGASLHNNNVVAAPPAAPAQHQGTAAALATAAGTWRRILLLIIAVTVHNIPEGLAVGVGFGAVGKTSSATFQNARNLAIGIGIQNFPEGLAVSLPLMGAGYSKFRSFWYGQLSGAVEPLAALLGAGAVHWAEPLLPGALAFAAGAMVYVVLDDIVPETATATAHGGGSNKLASWSAILGFVVMMVLDTSLG